MRAAYDVDELSLKILKGVGEEYNAITSAIKARETPVSFEELYVK